MDRLLVHENDFSLHHLAQWPVWGYYTKDNSKEVKIALNYTGADECSTAPFSLKARFTFASGFGCTGFLVAGDWDIDDVYCVSIWTGNRFLYFNRLLASLFDRIIAMANEDLGTTFAIDDVFPIRYETQVGEHLLDNSGIGLLSDEAGVFEFPEKGN